MKVALLCSDKWLAHERGLLRRMLVGLIDQSVEVVLVMPVTGREIEEQALGPAEHLWYVPSPWRWFRDHRISRLARDLREVQVDLLHIMDGSLQGIGLNLSRELDIPLACSVWSMREAATLRHTHRELPVVYLPASKGLVDAVRQRVGPSITIEAVSPGVFVGERSAQSTVAGSQRFSCSVIGDGRMDVHYKSLLEGMALIRPRMKEAVYFFCATDVEQHEIWETAEQTGMLDQMSLAPAEHEARKLLLQADVMIQPQPLGHVRTLLIEAMADRRVVLAAEDPAIDYLIDGKTARLVSGPDPEAWASALTWLADNPAAAGELSESAQKYTLNNHKASLFMTHLIQAYRRLAPQSLAFG